MPTRVRKSKDKSAYKDYEEIARLARNRREIEHERFRSFIDRKATGGVYFACNLVQERLNDLAKKAQVAMATGNKKQKIGAKNMTAETFSKKLTTFPGQNQADIIDEGFAKQKRNFETFKSFAKDLFPDLTGKGRGQLQLGHRNLAVATAKAAVYLEQLPADDPIRPQLRAYFLALKELDKITYEVLDPKATMTDLLTTVSKLEKEQDTDVKAKYELDVALMQGKAEQKIEFEHELAEVNKSKGQVAANIWKEINALLGDPQYEDAIAKSDLDFSRLTGSQSFLDGLTDGFMDIAITGKSSSKKTRSKKRVRGSNKKTKLGSKQISQKNKKVVAGINSAAKRMNAVRMAKTDTGDQGAGSRNSDLQLLSLLKAKLPQTVAENMGPPGLEYQTGRFASSVRPTDVVRTAQGHPSVGYTYQKNPYQVFEMGAGDSRWATSDRDPRKVIDLSVREIAAQLVVGRLYTRRV
jgi:hypothetical protein